MRIVKIIIVLIFNILLSYIFINILEDVAEYKKYLKEYNEYMRELYKK